MFTLCRATSLASRAVALFSSASRFGFGMAGIDAMPAADAAVSFDDDDDDDFLLTFEPPSVLPPNLLLLDLRGAPSFVVERRCGLSLVVFGRASLRLPVVEAAVGSVVAIDDDIVDRAIGDFAVSAAIGDLSVGDFVTSTTADLSVARLTREPRVIDEPLLGAANGCDVAVVAVEAGLATGGDDGGAISIDFAIERCFFVIFDASLSALAVAAPLTMC